MAETTSTLPAGAGTDYFSQIWSGVTTVASDWLKSKSAAGQAKTDASTAKSAASGGNANGAASAGSFKLTIGQVIGLAAAGVFMLGGIVLFALRRK